MTYEQIRLTSGHTSQSFIIVMNAWAGCPARCRTYLFPVTRGRRVGFPTRSAGTLGLRGPSVSPVHDPSREVIRSSGPHIAEPYFILFYSLAQYLVNIIRQHPVRHHRFRKF